MTNAIPLVLTRRSIDTLLDMVDNRLSSLESVDRDGARTLHDLTQAKLAMTQAKRRGSCSYDAALRIAGLK